MTTSAIDLLERELRDALSVVEEMARQHCHEDKDGDVDSGAISANADALLFLEKHHRFVVSRDLGRMVCGRWPESKEPTP